MNPGYCDFAIAPQSMTLTAVRGLCEAAIEAGYGTIAINTTLDETIFESRKKKKKGETREVIVDIIPVPLCLDSLKEEFSKKLKILQRLTVPLSTNLQAHKLMQSKNVSLYDLLAILPLTMQAHQNACAVMEVDIITYDPANQILLRITRKTIRQAVERGLHFELMYSPCILDNSARRNTIHLAHTYHSIGRSQNVIVSSGATHPTHIRGPYDIINLGLLFGLSEEKAKNAITHACRAVLLRAEARKSGKAVISVKPLALLNRGESWKIVKAEGTDQECSDDGEDMEDMSSVPPTKKSRHNN